MKQLFIFISVILWSSVGLAAAKGSLDTTFGVGGLLTTDISVGDDDYGEAVTIDNDGNIIAVGKSVNAADYDCSLVKYDANGNVIRTATINMGVGDQCNSVTIDASGKIVVGGYLYISDYEADIAVARFNSDLTVDTSFSSDGFVVASYTDVYATGTRDIAYDVAIDGDGNIVAVGKTDTGSGTNGNLALIWYDSTGNLVRQINKDGGSSNDEIIKSMAVDSSGRLVLAGEYMDRTTGDRSVLLARYKKSDTGTWDLDAAFGTGGWVISDFGSTAEYASDVAITEDGKILIAGSKKVSPADAATFDYDFFLARYNDSGTLDTTFGTGGSVTTDFSSTADIAEDYGNALAIDASGHIVVTGYTYISSPWPNDNIALARYDSNGALDAAFGTAGIVIQDLGSSYDKAEGVAIKTNGNIVLAGSMKNATDEQRIYALESYVGAVCGDGVIDGGETCDDGNTTSGDNCSATCVDETVPADADADGHTTATDCDDNNANINPGVQEVCSDSKDNDCDGTTDESDCQTIVDVDLDGYAAENDCNDNDAEINSGAQETCSDSKDNDCDGTIDETDCVSTEGSPGTEDAGDGGGGCGCDFSSQGGNGGSSMVMGFMALFALVVPLILRNRRTKVE